MRRLTVAAVAVAALVPATLGLVGNSSFAQSIPTYVPPSAELVTEPGDDSPHGVTTHGSTPSATRTAEAGDDKGGQTPRDARTEAGDDRGAHA